MSEQTQMQEVIMSQDAMIQVRINKDIKEMALKKAKEEGVALSTIIRQAVLLYTVSK
jgi:antitoxin component of RelBE/YafQ-DinJ toxin-antitoxin module